MQDRLIEESFSKYKEYLTAVIKAVCMDISDADVDDILSDVYLKLCRTSQMYDEDKASVKTYLSYIARNAAIIIFIFGGGAAYACANKYLFFENGRLVFSFNKNVVEEIADNTEWENDGERFSFSVEENRGNVDYGVKYTEYDKLSDFYGAEISERIKRLCDEQIAAYTVRCSRDDASWRVEIVCGENGAGVREIDIEPFGISDYLVGNEKEGVDLDIFEDGEVAYLISVQDDMTTIFFVDDTLLYTMILSNMQADEAKNFIRNYIIR